ncbi:MAG: hypothetical protein QOI10_335 [Solirubrobacterales bacterium]|jgi:antitoxin (DNA-binding transcriptional repressor) of toxin-antitoxin stability system|nr:hypothetical protein [Solirubrobacterales bacterium]
MIDPKSRKELFRRNRAAEAERAAALAKVAHAASAVREVTMTELDRGAARIVAAVRAGEIVVLSKHRCAVAMIVPLVREDGLVALDPREVDGLRELAKVFERRAGRRRMSALMHGRWYGKQYRRYRTGRGSRRP